MTASIAEEVGARLVEAIKAIDQEWLDVQLVRYPPLYGVVLRDRALGSVDVIFQAAVQGARTRLEFDIGWTKMSFEPEDLDEMARQTLQYARHSMDVRRHQKARARLHMTEPARSMLTRTGGFRT